MRHYNTNTNEVLKLAFTFYTGIITLTLGIYEFIFQQNPNDNLSLLYISLILSLSFIVGLIAINLVVTNRRYFIKEAHQINIIRDYFTRNMKEFDNILPVDTDFPVRYHIKSSQVIIMLLLVFTNSTVLFFAVFALLLYFHLNLILILVIPFILSAAYFFFNHVQIKNYLQKD